MNDEIKFEDIKNAVLSLWRRKLLIIIITAAALFAGIALTYGKGNSNTYGARSSVYGAIYGSYQESADATTAMISYADVLTSQKVCERAASLLADPDVTAADIQNMITASYSSTSIILEVVAYSSDAQLAMNVANATAQAFVIEMQTILGSDGIQMLDSASNAFISENGRSSVWKNRLLITAFGFVTACGLFFVMELASNQIKSINQCLIEPGDKILGVIPDETDKKNERNDCI